MDKLELLLDMTEHPDRYTKQQMRELLADEDVRKYYDVMVQLREAYALEAEEGEKRDGEKKRKREVKNEGVKSEKYKLQEPVESNSVTEGKSYFSLFTLSLFTFKKIAAIFLAAAFLSGLAFAAYQLLSPHDIEIPSGAVGEANTPSPTGRAGDESSIRFSDVRLDSILSVVAAHYKQQVLFLDEAPRELRFTITWNSEDALATFIMMLNEFDGLHLCNKQDTIFVESVEAKEE